MHRNWEPKRDELDAILLEYAEPRDHQVVAKEVADHILDNDLLPRTFFKDADRKYLLARVQAKLRVGVRDQDGILRHFSNFQAEAANGAAEQIMLPFYKDDRYLSPEQCRQQWDYCTGQMDAFDKRRVYYRDLCVSLHGLAVTQTLFPRWEDLGEQGQV